MHPLKAVEPHSKNAKASELPTDLAAGTSRKKTIASRRPTARHKKPAQLSKSIEIIDDKALNVALLRARGLSVERVE